MSRYKVTPESVREARDELNMMTGTIEEAFEEMMNALSQIGDVFTNSKTEEIIKILSVRKMNFLSTKANLQKAIDNLDLIAAQYEAAERDNINELHTIN